MKRWLVKHETLVIILSAFLMTALLCLFIWNVDSLMDRESVQVPDVSEEVVTDTSEADADAARDAYAKWWYYNNFILRW